MGFSKRAGAYDIYSKPRCDVFEGIVSELDGPYHCEQHLAGLQLVR